MKKAFKASLAVALIVALLMSLTVFAYAASEASQNGVEITLTTDKDEYVPGEDINVTVSIKNVNDYDVNDLELKIELPEGLTLKSGELQFSGVSIPAGETIVKQVTAVKIQEKQEIEDTPETNPPQQNITPDTETVPDTGSSQNTRAAQTGDNLYLLIAVSLLCVLVIAVLLIIKFRKKATKVLSVIICVIMVSAVIPFSSIAAPDDPIDLTAEKTVKVDGKEYTFRAVLNTPVIDESGIESSILIDVDNQGDPIVTSDSTITLTGRVTSAVSLRSVTVRCTNYYNEDKEFEVDGKEEWTSTVDLEIGTNVITVTATDNKDFSESREITVNRTNTEINFGSKVKSADAIDYQQLHDDIIAAWTDDKNTPADESDDQIIMLVPEQALLLSQIRASMLLPGEVYFIPQNELFLTGFTGIYNSTRAPQGNEDHAAAD